MAYLILPSRWRRQPQYAVDINWSNEITRSLRIALQYGDPRCSNFLPINLATGKAMTRVGTNVPELHTGPGGRAYGISGTTNYLVPDVTVAFTGTTTIAFRKNGLTSDGSRGVFFGGSSNSDWIGCDTSNRPVIIAASTTRHTGIALRDNQVVGINFQTSNWKSYNDGVESVTASGSSSGANIVRIQGLDGGFSVYRNRLYCLYLFGRLLSAPEHRSLAEAPFQIFKPANIRRYFLPSDGALAVTLAATESADTAAFTARDTAQLAATEAADSAAFTSRDSAHLTAIEGADSAAFAFTPEVHEFVFAAVEAADSAAFIATDAQALAAIEAADTAAFTLLPDVTEFALAASESPDVAAFALTEEQVPVVVPEAGAKRGRSKFGLQPMLDGVAVVRGVKGYAVLGGFWPSAERHEPINTEVVLRGVHGSVQCQPRVSTWASLQVDIRPQGFSGKGEVGRLQVYGESVALPYSRTPRALWVAVDPPSDCDVHTVCRNVGSAQTGHLSTKGVRNPSDEEMILLIAAVTRNDNTRRK